MALAAAVCGDDDAGTATSSSEVSTTDHNDADVKFALRLLRHHAQALSMVDLTQGPTLDPEVQQLAEQIREAQAPEIETFTDWLAEWDEEVPETVRDHSNVDLDMDDDSMNDENMGALEDASDADFQTTWLRMMTEHHEGADEMAKVELGDGQYEPAVDLAGDIVESQTAEIETMQGLLP